MMIGALRMTFKSTGSAGPGGSVRVLKLYSA